MIVLHFPYRIMVCFHDGFVAKSTLLVKATVCCHQVVPLNKKKKKRKEKLGPHIKNSVQVRPHPAITSSTACYPALTFNRNGQSGRG